MARKSDRNKSNAADKSEKAAPASRKSGRPTRRRKKSASDSEPEPEPDVTTEETSEEIPLPPQPKVADVVESTETSEPKGRRGRPRKQPPVEVPPEKVEPEPSKENNEQTEWKEDGAFWGESSKAGPEQGTTGTEISTWKVQSSNGSGGEIQKLKICRQRLTDSAESSSSPSKELASPRRKRYKKRKERHEGDGESVGSHSDAETPTSTVNDVAPVAEAPAQVEVDSTSNLDEITLPVEKTVTQEADSATETSEKVSSPHSTPPADVVEEDKKDDIEMEAVPQEATTESVQSSEVTEVDDKTEKSETEAESKTEDADRAPDTSTAQESEEVEEGELKQPQKPKDFLKLSVSNEDALQQIAKKLNERAARFSKEATEEIKRIATARPSKESIEEEDQEEGEISRDTSSVKTLELKRLTDEDNEAQNKTRTRARRQTAVQLSSPSDASIQNDKDTLKFNVSTETLKEVISGEVELVTEEEVAYLFTPNEDEPEPKVVISDEESAGEPGEVVEEEGELVENDKAGKAKLLEERVKDEHHSKKSGHASRDESKRSERRVIKESPKKSSKTDRKERRSSVDEPKAKKKSDKENIKKEKEEKTKKIKLEKPLLKSEENHKPVRKIAIVSDDAKNSVRRSISPPMKQPSQVLFITNLVRPFTIGQLRELLARTGTLSPNGFYIDKIKSKCFVKYNDVEMAIETRHALHGVRWPVTNPRTLRVDFSTDEAMEAVKKLAEEEENAAKKQDLAAHGGDTGWLSERDVIKPPKKPKNSVREWDMGKDINEIQETVKKGKEEEWGVKSKEKRLEKTEGVKRRPVSPPGEKIEPARKMKKRDNDAPAKLLDDLFRKTEATPCIYWLPLTASQIAVKEEIRRQHMAEHQKRLAEMKKTESLRREKEKSRDRDRERERYRDRRRK